MTQLCGVFIFFAGLWMVSVFGNYGHLEEWAKVRQYKVILYAIIFGAFSILTLYYGIRHKDDAIRDTGIVTLLLNIYTRYFEYFWDNTNKGLFFLLLGLSFYMIGRWLEKQKRYADKVSGA